jgi:hypothetical protein
MDGVTTFDNVIQFLFLFQIVWVVGLRNV